MKKKSEVSGLCLSLERETDHSPPPRGQGGVLTVGGHGGGWMGGSSRRRLGGVRNPVVWTKKAS